MPYSGSKTGKSAPDCALPCYAFPKGEISAGRFVHGDCVKCCGCCCPCCPTCEIQCCSFDCNMVANCFVACQGPCAAIFALLLTCETICQANCAKICAVSPEIPCKASGCELTLGQAALEDKIGVWHLATDTYPMFLPSILFPCGCFPLCPGFGQDETLSGDTFSPGGPTQTKTVKIFELACGMCIKLGPCAPHTSCKLGICGFCMNPIFGGELPLWFCTECKYPSIKFSKAGAAVATA